MQENSSNPPATLQHSTIPCAPPSCVPGSNPPTHEIMKTNDTLRDVFVRLCRPTKIACAHNPKIQLAELLAADFFARGYILESGELEQVLDTLIERDLIIFDAKRCLYLPTCKAGTVMDMLFIVTCDKCSTSHVKTKHEPGDIEELLFCRKCGDLIK
jgi:hypothetical protein